jgi:hypothetical protein
MCFPGIDDVSGKNEFARLFETDGACQKVAAAVAGREPELAEDLAEVRILASNPNVRH